MPALEGAESFMGLMLLGDSAGPGSCLPVSWVPKGVLHQETEAQGSTLPGWPSRTWTRSISVPGFVLSSVPAEGQGIGGKVDPVWRLNQGPPLLQPSTCPHLVTERAKADAKFGEIFRFDTPVLMWDQHFTPETWDRLKTRHVPYGWQGLPHAGTDPAGVGVAADGARVGDGKVQGSLRGLGSPAEGPEDMEQAEEPSL